MSYYNFKRIQVVPSSSDFVDIILSKTQRKTPTVIHPNYSIGRIRQFYMRKVKYAQEAFNEKFTDLLGQFPKLDDIHPFYSDLMNVLYDKDHYKLALGQLNTARHLIEQLAKDYVRLLKFGDSLYRCKQLKRAALGRMATIIKGQRDSLAYLEQVRQHLARLPSIDPNTRTLLVCGYPNVGKSSFMNKLTRADVEVQPYAFTTKSLFVGHMDYEYVRWQVIDTPGILDHPLEDRNTIEMQSITALAHLKAAILFFIDLSEQCGYSIKEQTSLFHSIRPLFANKPVLLVVNKIDVRKYEDLDADEKVLVDGCLTEGVTLVQQSCWTDDGVMQVRNSACAKLLAMRVETKLRANKMDDVLSRLNVAMPQARDNKARPAFIPAELASRKPYDANDPDRRKLERDLELEQGGPGVYSVDLRKKYLLADDEWKYDAMPEIMDGKNVADFFDAEIEERLKMLELEEERLAAEGHYDSDQWDESDEEEAAANSELKAAAETLRAKKLLIQQANQLKRGKNRPSVGLKVKAKTKTIDEFAESLAKVSMEPDMDRARDRVANQRKRSRSEVRPQDHDANKRSRLVAGLATTGQKDKAESLRRQTQKVTLKHGRAGEADRHIAAKLPKHLFTGKRGLGTSDRR
ncbi:P-loop containing nucleoside triphosphate hydrolase protein [Catenaria anguillulae PL171]|uniref:Nucleolar GTP-binding protein 1 n=1 Tax=Catenaria anguillulae PL171 TaxID=765915 RepID=A0A1Y2HUU2_9FUNG|nr:P-loop containing nucleoside triphosphate hydrolase protein [Catenaria anguillulae PL171]